MTQNQLNNQLNDHLSDQLNDQLNNQLNDRLNDPERKPSIEYSRSASDYGNLPPAYSNEFLPPIARSLKFGGLVLLSLLSVAFTFAATVKYNVVVKAAGVVVPEKMSSAATEFQATETNSVPFLVRAYVAEQDINRVAAGQSVKLRLNACPYPDYGTLQGAVRSLSPDTVALPAGMSRASLELQTSYYEVMIQPAAIALIKDDRSCSIRAGMKVNASILSHQETVLDLMLRRM